MSLRAPTSSNYSKSVVLLQFTGLQYLALQHAVCGCGVEMMECDWEDWLTDWDEGEEVGVKLTEPDLAHTTPNVYTNISEFSSVSFTPEGLTGTVTFNCKALTSHNPLVGFIGRSSPGLCSNWSA